MLTVSSDVHQQHHGLELSRGQIIASTEGPDRAELIAAALLDAGHETIEPDSMLPELVAKVHTPEYLEFLETAWDRWLERSNPGPAAMGFTWPARGLTGERPDDLVGQLGFHSFTADCSIVAGTWAAASTAAAIATTAADRMLEGGGTTFALCRPPGHHATADQFGGYCYINNAAVAAQRLLDRGAERVAVLDVDYHHGNGTQSIFYDRSDVLFVSLHANPTFEFPWFVGHATEIGEGRGEGWNLNLPLDRGTELHRYVQTLDVGLERIRDAGVDGLVVSLGVDTFEDDPLGTFSIPTAGFTTIAAKIAELALPTVLVQEGGYAVADIGTNVASFLDGFS